MSLGRIGSFELRKKLGEGGMGLVFLATDSRLGRDVALKVLPDSFANDPMRMARFEREARLLASLNHPNIAAIHGIEESEGKKALGTIEPFRKGIGIFARDLRAPVFPVYVEGTAAVYPDDAWWPRIYRTRLVIGRPLRIDPGADAAETARRLEAAVRKLGAATSRAEEQARRV